jgi:hypothetical protein
MRFDLNPTLFNHDQLEVCLLSQQAISQLLSPWSSELETVPGKKAYEVLPENLTR